MNFCNLLKWIIFPLTKSNRVFLFFVMLLALSAQNFEVDFFHWSEKIENDGVSDQEKQKAVEKIIAMGKEVLPLVEKKLQQTKNSHYFYIRENIQNSQKQVNAWSKQFYFKEKYQQALQFAEQKKYDAAIKIIDAILVLEPNIVFASDAKAFVEKLRKEQNPGDQFISVDVLPLVKYYAFTDKLQLSLSIKNLSSASVVLNCGLEYLDFKITTKEFYLSGNSRVDSYTKSVKIKKQIIISGGGYWERIITIPQNSTTDNCYQEMEVETSIKLVTLETEEKNIFLK